MEAKTLPADVCIFSQSGRLSPAAVHSVDCPFDFIVKWWIHVLSIVTYLHKNFFFALKQLQKLVALLLLIDCEQTRNTLSTQLSHWQMFMQNAEYIAFWYVQLFCYLMQLQIMISQNELE